MHEEYAFGIDTSNYKTSVAIVDNHGRIHSNLQRYLDVKKGERGLRQSVALFQHINNLPELIEEAFDGLKDASKICCICASSKPRPVEGSYMPVFNAGISAGRTLAAALGVPFFTVSHQENHIEAVRHGSPVSEVSRFVSFHFSGGTSEALLVEGDRIRIVGGSKDLAFGQVLDRVGVAMGMEFPAGSKMDQFAETPYSENLLPKIRCIDGFINLSGIETKCQRILSHVDQEQLCAMLFDRLSDAIEQMCLQLQKTYQINVFLFAGGVSSSTFIRKKLKERLPHLNIYFGDPALSTDNAVGTALLGGKRIWL